MKDKLRKILIAALSAVFAISCLLVGSRLLDYRVADRSYESAKALVSLPDNMTPAASLPSEHQISPVDTETVPCPVTESLDSRVQFLLDMDIGALRQVNGRVFGWIYIPDTGIDYPLMAYDDNYYGLNYTWDNKKSGSGSIFMECENSRDFSDFNTIIYGHNMRNGTMFSELGYYSEESYLRDHPCIYVLTDGILRRYQVFSAYEAKVDSDTFRLVFEGDQGKQTALDYYISSSVAKTDLVPTESDKILTLSTCTGTGNYDARWVVQAVLTGEFTQ